MKLPRAAILTLVFLACGALASYAVAWWAMYRFDVHAPRTGAEEILTAPTEWPIPTPAEWPLMVDYPGDNPFDPYLRQWSGPAIAVRTYVSTMNNLDILSIEEVRAGWPAATSSTFVQHSWPFNGTPRASPDVHRPWYGGVHLVDRTHTVAPGFSWNEPVYFPVRPVWPGLLINSVFYGTSLSVLTLPSRHFVRLSRTHAGICPHCKYPIGTSPVCTECGKPVTHLPPAPTSGLS